MATDDLTPRRRDGNAHPVVPLPDRHHRLHAVCQAVVEANPNWTSDVSTYVSNGPFMLTEYSSLNRLVLSKNPNYYLADEVQIDEVQFVIIPDSATGLTAYNNGEINVFTSLNQDALNQYMGTEEFHSSGRIGIQYCDFNTTLEEFSDKRVRPGVRHGDRPPEPADRAGLQRAARVRLHPLCAAVADRFDQALPRSRGRYVRGERRGRARR